MQLYAFFYLNEPPKHLFLTIVYAQKSVNKERKNYVMSFLCRFYVVILLLKFNLDRCVFQSMGEVAGHRQAYF